MAKKKKVIAVDIDEVLFPFLDEFIKDHNQKYKSDLKKEHFTSYEFSEVIGVKMPEAVKRIYEFQERIAGSNTQPFKDSQEAISKISKDYDLKVITARHPKFDDITLSWLNKHYPNYFKEIIAIGFAPVMERPRTKAEVCKEINAIALIDDSLINVSECAEIGIRGILFGEYYWNKSDILPNGVVRCHDWPSVVDLLESSLL